MNEAKIQGKVPVSKNLRVPVGDHGSRGTKKWTFLRGHTPARKKHSILNVAKIQGKAVSIALSSEFAQARIGILPKIWTFL